METNNSRAAISLFSASFLVFFAYSSFERNAASFPAGPTRPHDHHPPKICYNNEGGQGFAPAINLGTHFQALGTNGNRQFCAHSTSSGAIEHALVVENELFSGSLG